MKRKEAGELWAWASVVTVVELSTAQRHGLSLGALRVLVRLAALTHSGALIRAVDLATFAGHGDASRDSAHLRRMRKPGGWVVLTGGANGTGTYSLSEKGLRVAQEYARGWKRAAEQVERFEPVQVWRRLKPKPE